MNVQHPKLPFKLVENPNAAPTAEYGRRQLEKLSPRGLAQAREAISAWPGCEPTPLIRLPELATALGIGVIYSKQQTERFGLRRLHPPWEVPIPFNAVSCAHCPSG